MTARGVISRAFEERASIWMLPVGDAKAGGDWCDLVKISDDVVALTIGDVSGHGEAVAVTMAAMQTCVKRAIQQRRDPAEILCVVNDFAFHYGRGVIVSAIVAFLNRRLHTLTFANAGHPPPLLLSAECHAFLAHLPADLPLGIYPQYRAANYVVVLPDDALLVLYTDGITEHARDPVCGERDLVEAARLVYERPAIDDAEAVARNVLSSGSGHDDAALMVVRAIKADM